MTRLVLVAVLSASPDAQFKGRFVSHGAVVFDESIISLESQPAQVADLLMQTEAGMLLSDNVQIGRAHV